MKIKKKTYNPFKMWGSYVGATVGWIYHLNYCNFNIMTKCLEWYGTFMFKGILIGFLIGWGIHSLIRRIKNDTKKATNK